MSSAPEPLFIHSVRPKKLIAFTTLLRPSPKDFSPYIKSNLSWRQWEFARAQRPSQTQSFKLRAAQTLFVMSTAGPEGQRSGRSCNCRTFIVKSSAWCFHTLQILPNKRFTSVLLVLKGETAESFRDSKSPHPPTSPLDWAGEQHGSSPTLWLGNTGQGGFAGVSLLALAPFTSAMFCFPLPKINHRFAICYKQPMAYCIWEYRLPLTSISGNRTLSWSGW